MQNSKTYELYKRNTTSELNEPITKVSKPKLYCVKKYFWRAKSHTAGHNIDVCTAFVGRAQVPTDDDGDYDVFYFDLRMAPGAIRGWDTQTLIIRRQPSVVVCYRRSLQTLEELHLAILCTVRGCTTQTSLDVERHSSEVVWFSRNPLTLIGVPLVSLCKVRNCRTSDHFLYRKTFLRSGVLQLHFIDSESTTFGVSMYSQSLLYSHHSTYRKAFFNWCDKVVVCRL